MRRPCKPELVAVAALVYIPFLLSSPERVSADSNQYLYVDPGSFLRRTVDLWDPSVGAGGVPHQHLGYLFPVAPLFWAMDAVGLPDWVAQRLWLGTLTFLAVLGARWLFLQLGAGRAGALAGALIYGLTPYQLAFTARISVLLMPWVALPWIVGLTMRATRERGWRTPALLGLVLLLAGGINASSLLLVGVAPLLWLVLEAWRGPLRPVLASTGRLAVVALGVSIWWLVGLRLQGSYGLPVLQMTENLRTVAEWSAPGDVLRGLGNWFFYGRDASGFSIDQAEAYDSNSLVVALSYAVPVVGLIAALLLRWAHRTYFCLLVILGTIISVGAWPYDDATPYGRAWKAFTTDTSAGLAFRNSPRAVPMIVLGFAAVLAAAVAAVPRGVWTRVGAGAVAVLALGALLPVWQDGYLSDGHHRPEDLPDYWLAAAADLDGADHGTRILELPGSTFADYRWGNLVDPLTPGLTDRPYVAREVLPYGTPPSVNLLDALDRRAQLGVLDAASIAPVARLLGVGTVSLRADLAQSDRGFSPPPGPVWDALNEATGLRHPRLFGPPGGDGSDPDMPAVALYDVDAARPIVRTAPTAEPVVLDGDGDGIVDAAAAGLLDGGSLVLQPAALDDDQLAAALDAGADLIVTDSSRRRIQTWFYALRDTRGHTERAGETAADPTGYDFRLSPFTEIDDDDRTVVEQDGGAVEVTSDGGPDRPEDRGAHAVDGDPTTAWRVGGDDVRGQAITLVPDDPPTVDEILLLQPPSARRGRAVQSVTVQVGDGEPFEVVLGPESLTAPGQAVAIPRQPATSVRVEITGTTEGPDDDPFTPVGLAEISVGSMQVAEVVRLPVALLDRVGDDLAAHSLDLVLTRLRLELPGTDRLDDESHLDRRFDLPVGRSFQVAGTVRATGGGPMAPIVGCRADLLAIDGHPLPVRASASEPGSGGSTGITSCEPVDLAAGIHRVTSSTGAITGVDVDQVVLSSDAAGQPAEVAPRGAPSQLAPPVTDADVSASSVTADIDAAGSPFWFVLGQSAADGWTIEAEGAAVGQKVLVDGYANGWVVTPDGPGPIVVRLRWEPQRLVWAGLAVSGVAVLACATIVLLKRSGRVPSLASPPSLVSPLAVAVRPLPTVASAALVVGAVAFVVATPAVAGAAALLTVVAGIVPRGRVVLVAVAPLALVASRLVVERPSLAWLGVAVLLADLLLSRRETQPSA